MVYIGPGVVEIHSIDSPKFDLGSLARSLALGAVRQHNLAGGLGYMSTRTGLCEGLLGELITQDYQQPQRGRYRIVKGVNDCETQ